MDTEILSRIQFAFTISFHYIYPPLSIGLGLILVIMEGLYLKHEEHGRVVARYKYVRAGFLQAVADSGEHWMDRPIEPNRLRAGVDLFA